MNLLGIEALMSPLHFALAEKFHKIGVHRVYLPYIAVVVTLTLILVAADLAFFSR